MAAYLPPGWPAGVHPPGSERFEQTAVNWLLDVVPPDYRVHGVLLRHPVALAALARHHVTACVEGARQGYRTARAELAADLPPGVIEAVLAVYRSEGSRLAAAARSVDLIERALHGEVFLPQLGGRQEAARHVTGGSGARQPGSAMPAEQAAARQAPRREQASRQEQAAPPERAAPSVQAAPAVQASPSVQAAAPKRAARRRP
ncbi:MAG: hypothetical protein ACLPUO_04210 [Streptosporangiaceae bacterium]